MEKKNSAIVCKCSSPFYIFADIMMSIIVFMLVYIGIVGSIEEKTIVYLLVSLMGAALIGYFLVKIILMQMNQYYILSENSIFFQDFRKKQYRYSPDDIKGIRVENGRIKNKYYVAVFTKDTPSKIIILDSNCTNYHKAKNFLIEHYTQI